MPFRVSLVLDYHKWTMVLWSGDRGGVRADGPSEGGHVNLQIHIARVGSLAFQLAARASQWHSLAPTLTQEQPIATEPKTPSTITQNKQNAFRRAPPPSHKTTAILDTPTQP